MKKEKKKEKENKNTNVSHAPKLEKNNKKPESFIHIK